MHRLLARQPAKTGLSSESAPTAEAWRALLRQVEDAYDAADQDRYTLERSIEISSEEMRELYDALRASSDAAIAEKNAELEESLALARGIEDAVADGLMAHAHDGRVLFMNRHFRRLWGLPEDAAYPTWRDAFGEVTPRMKRPEVLAAAIEEAVRSPDATLRTDLELADGRVFERVSAPLRSTSGERIGRIVSLRDVTEQRRLAADRVVIAERMSALGQLVASVAHEMNNPLSYVTTNVEMARDALAGKVDLGQDEIAACLDDVLAGLERMAVIVGDLRMLSRRDEERRAPADVRRAVEAALSVAKGLLSHRARVVRDLREVPLVFANDARLTQVFLNLLVNAAQALPDACTTCRTVTVSSFTDARGFAVVAVADTGTGIAPEHLPHLFDPFFTTKPAGTGTGLGLPICLGIVEKLGGSIRVETKLGEGTTFYVELPPAAQGAIASPAAWPRSAA